MKIHPALLPVLLLGASAPLLTSCTSAARKPPAPANAAAVSGKPDGKSVAAAEDDLDEYSGATIADPLEPVNRVTFWVNHQVYTIVLRPVSKGYEKVVPRLVRRGLDNAFENVKFPVRAVNDVLQGNLPRAGRETGKFVVNTVVGVGGLARPSDHFPALADVPAADTGQTFAKWGIGHGFYLVLPLLGPSSLRDGVGLAGDYALNPLTWLGFWYGGYDWFIAIPATNTVRASPGQLAQYDAAIKNSLDRYLAVRTAYAQYRKEVATK